MERSEHIRNGAHLNGWSVGGGQGQISGEGKRQRKRKTVARRKVVTAVLSELVYERMF